MLISSSYATSVYLCKQSCNPFQQSQEKKHKLPAKISHDKQRRLKIEHHTFVPTNRGLCWFFVLHPCTTENYVVSVSLFNSISLFDGLIKSLFFHAFPSFHQIFTYIVKLISPNGFSGECKTMQNKIKFSVRIYNWINFHAFIHHTQSGNENIGFTWFPRG